MSTKFKFKPRMQRKVFKKFGAKFQYWGGKDNEPLHCMHGTPSGRLCLQCHIDRQYAKNKKGDSDGEF